MWFKIIIASTIGTALEIYDFTLYGVFAVTIAKLFFPQHDNFLSLLISLGVFASGFIMRPLGGIFFGHIGDLYGRKLALTLAVLIMSIATLIMGLTPTYLQIGTIAPIILITCRLIQGFCAGGEYNGASIFIIEHFKKRGNPAFAGALIPASGASGACLAMFLGSIMLAISEECWRIPFLLGAFIGLIGLRIRHDINETPEFADNILKNASLKIPIVRVLKQYYNSVLCTIGIGGTQVALSYTLFTYINLYLTQTVKINTSHSMMLNSLGILTYVIFTPILGILTDRTNYIKAMVIGALIPIFSIYPVFLLLSNGNGYYIIIAQICFGLTLAAFVAPVNIFMNKLFSTEVRYSGVAFGYGLGSAILGGTLPLIASYLVELLDSKLMPAFYLLFCSLIGLCSVLYGISIINQKSRH